MCGIYACYLSNEKVEVSTLKKAISTLSHRGPDESSYWISKNKKVGLANTRLRINDMSKINLPISNNQENVFLISNGEFYDYKKQRQVLIEQGHKFRTETDSEIVLHLYEDMGINCLGKLRGEFSFIIWDERAETLLAVRDRFGVKPLYYSAKNGSVHLSSEIPTLMHVDAVAPTWDIQSLFNFTHYNLTAERTLFEDISQIPAGHYMIINKYGVRIVRYWDTNYPVSHDYRDESDIITEVHDALSESIKLRLDSDVPVGCYLSGGLDSSVILGLSSQLAGKPLDSFNISFDDKLVDEGDIASRTAKYINSELHTLHLNDIDLKESFEDAVIAAAHPMANAAGVARFLLSKFAANHGYKTVFSGEGADELFFGYNFLTYEAVCDPNCNIAIDDCEAYIEKSFSKFPVDRSNIGNIPGNISSIQHCLGFIPRWIETQAFFNASHRNLLSDEVKNHFNNYNTYMDFINKLDITNQLKDRDHATQSSYIWLKSFFPNNMLNWIGDRVEMAHSIEARLPYLDHILFEKIKRIPTHLHIKNGIEKYILRESAKKYIPKEIYQREKFIFQAPPMRIAGNNSLFSLTREIIMSNIKLLYMYDEKKLIKFIDSYCKEKNTHWARRVDISTTLMVIASIAIISNNFHVA